MAVCLTSRDVDILKWINRFGFMNINHITSFYKITKPTAYARLRKLISSGLLLHEYHLHGQPGIYRVTREGARLTGEEMLPRKEVRLSNLHHDAMVVSVILSLHLKHQCQVITERELRRNAGFMLRGHKVHFPDGALILADKKVALEVELTAKSKKRLERILFNYWVDNDYDEVWYFCGSKEVRNKVNRLASDYDKIKINNL